MSTVNHTARLILEASTGMHGDIPKQLADAWTAMAEKAAPKDEDQERADFEMRVYSDHFIRSVKFNAKRPFADCSSVSKAELCRRDANGDYARVEIAAMWYGWKLAKGMVR